MTGLTWLAIGVMMLAVLVSWGTARRDRKRMVKAVRFAALSRETRLIRTRQLQDQRNAAYRALGRLSEVALDHGISLDKVEAACGSDINILRQSRSEERTDDHKPA